MQVYCQRSGIEFTVENFANIKLEGVHPLFYASTKQLLSRAGDWAAGKLNEKERRILFLALLNSTELVEFRVTAKPADAVVQMNMESLLKFISWQCGIQSPALALPRFAITNETKDLANCKHWIEAWWSARRDFEDGYKSQGELAKLRNMELALERLIKTATKRTEDYAGTLAKWALTAAQVPAALHDYWTDLFKLRGLHIYNASKVDLEELQEHMEEYLEHGSIFASATLRHVRMLVAKNKHGLNFGLGIPDEELEKMDLEALNAGGYKILESSTGVGADNVRLAATAAPVEEPMQKNYKDRISFLKAKAAWQMSIKAKQYADEVIGADAILEQTNSLQAAEDAAADADSCDDAAASNDQFDLGQDS